MTKPESKASPLLPRLIGLVDRIRIKGSSILPIRVASQVLAQWARDRCPQQAASLAFQTVLSIVPLLAVTLAVLRATGAMEAESSFVDFIATEMLPVSREHIASNLIAWSGNITFKSLGIVGLVTTLILAFIMINSLERIINTIWRSERRRSLAQKFIVFYATATIAPLLMGTSLYHATRFGLTSGVAGFALSFFATLIALFFANYFLPARSVRFRSAAIGALISAVLFELAKHAFRLYVTQFALAKFEGIYGAVAIIPLFLLWVYYCWLTMLLGVETAYASDNLHILEHTERRQALSLEQQMERVNGPVAARVMVEICRVYSQGDKSISRRRLQDQFDLTTNGLESLLHRLKTRSLVLEVEGDHPGLLPARPPSTISLRQVLDAFRSDDIQKDSGTNQSKLDQVLADLDAHTQQRTDTLQLSELL